MTLEGLVYALTGASSRDRSLMKAIASSMILLRDNSPQRKVKIVNFGENIDSLLLPKYLEGYLIPFMKGSNQLRDNGIYTHIHIDGHFSLFLSI